MAVGPSAEVIQAVEVYDAVQELFEGNLKADVRACLLEFSRRKQVRCCLMRTCEQATAMSRRPPNARSVSAVCHSRCTGACLACRTQWSGHRQPAAPRLTSLQKGEHDCAVLPASSLSLKYQTVADGQGSPSLKDLTGHCGTGQQC